MLSALLFSLVFLSLLSALLTGKTASLTPGLLDGAKSALELLLATGGPLVFWSGLSEVFSDAGWIGRLSRLTRPLLRFLLRPKEDCEELWSSLSENFSANLLGIGNAATPAGLRGAELLSRSGDEEGLARLTLLNACSVQLVPFTAASIAASAGDPRPFSLTPAVLGASLFSVLAAFSVFSLLSPLRKGRKSRD